MTVGARLRSKIGQSKINIDNAAKFRDNPDTLLRDRQKFLSQDTERRCSTRKRKPH